jgi:hypothetical protein
MPVRTRQLVFILVAGTLTVSAALHAQFPKPHLPKLPSVPGVKEAAPATPPPATKVYCTGITDEKIDQYIKAKQVQAKVLAQELAKANANKAKAEALTKERGQGVVNEMVKLGECTDAFKEKDPRSKEIARLEGLEEAATNSGNEAKAEQYHKRGNEIEELREVDADRACGGRGFSALYDCREKKVAGDDRATDRDKLRRLADEAGKKGDQQKQAEYTQQADQLGDRMKAEAQMACMAEHPGIGLVGARAASSEEEGATAAAEAGFRNAKANADQAGMDAAKLTQDEFAMLDHCITRVIKGDPSTPAPPESKAAIQRRAGDLKPLVSQ